MMRNVLIELHANGNIAVAYWPRQCGLIVIQQMFVVGLLNEIRAACAVHPIFLPGNVAENCANLIQRSVEYGTYFNAPDARRAGRREYLYAVAFFFQMPIVS